MLNERVIKLLPFMSPKQYAEIETILSAVSRDRPASAASLAGESPRSKPVSGLSASTTAVSGRDGIRFVCPLDLEAGQGIVVAKGPTAVQSSTHDDTEAKPSKLLKGSGGKATVIVSGASPTLLELPLQGSSRTGKKGKERQLGKKPQIEDFLKVAPPAKGHKAKKAAQGASPVNVASQGAAPTKKAAKVAGPVNAAPQGATATNKAAKGARPVNVALQGAAATKKAVQGARPVTVSSQGEAKTKQATPMAQQACSSGETRPSWSQVAAANPMPRPEAPEELSTVSEMEVAEDNGSWVTSDSECGGDSFQVVGPKRRKRKRRSTGTGLPSSAPAPQAVASAKVRPVVLEGLNAGEKKDLTVFNLLKANLAEDYVTKIVTTKQGYVLLFPKTEAFKTRLLQLSLRDGLTIRETKGRSIGPNGENSVVVKGIDPSITDSELTEALGQKCTRLRCFRTQTATWKVRVMCNSAAARDTLLKAGAFIGHRRYPVEAYKGKQPVLQCYQCQGFGHVAAACKKEQKCPNCAGNHKRKDCKAAQPTCANCNGAHESSSYACPKLVGELAKKSVKSLSVAEAVKPKADRIDSVRLACGIAASLSAVLIDRLHLEIGLAELCKDVAGCISRHLKVDVPELYVRQCITPATVSSESILCVSSEI